MLAVAYYINSVSFDNNLALSWKVAKLSVFVIVFAILYACVKWTGCEQDVNNWKLYLQVSTYFQWLKSAIYQGYCKIVSESHPPVIVKIRPYLKDTGRDDSGALVRSLLQWLPRHPNECLKQQLVSDEVLRRIDADRLLYLLHKQVVSISLPSNKIHINSIQWGPEKRVSLLKMTDCVPYAPLGLRSILEEWLKSEINIFRSIQKRFARHLKQECARTSEYCFPWVGQQFTCKALDFVSLRLATQQQNDASHLSLVIGVVDKKFDNSWSYFCDPVLDGDGRQINSKVKGHKVFKRHKSSQTVVNDLHGNSCAALAAGYYMDADYFGIIRGIIRGSVPRSRIALYECDVLNPYNLFDGIVAAAVDGVDVISCSIGPSQHTLESIKESFAKGLVRIYPMSLGTLVATVSCGVLCVVPAGNYGVGKVANYAPWELVVGSCNTYSKIVTEIVLGNGQSIQGYSTNLFQGTGHCPLVLYDDACDNKSGSKKLSRQKAENKIILYDSNEIRGSEAKQVKAAGSIYRESNESFHSYVLPAACVSETDYDKIVFYITNWREAATAELFPTAEVTGNTEEFPVLMSYSARGRSPIACDLIKPDICAPGQLLIPTKSVVQAWADDGIKECQFYIGIGTSFASALVAGVVAHLKSLHPSFSPAAIKSALLTTARMMKIKSADDILGFGSGVVDVAAAASVTLVYDIEPVEYIRYLKWLGFDILGASKRCGSKRLRHLGEVADGILPLHPRNLNLPNIAGTFVPGEIRWDFRRRLKQVKKGRTTWTCVIAKVEGLKIDAKPGVLTFDKENEEKEYVLEVEVLDWKKAGNYGFQTHLEWRFVESKIRSVIRISRSDILN